MKPSECSRPKSGFALSITEGAKGPRDDRVDTFCQYTRSACLAPSRPPAAKPSANTTALTAPALVPVMPSKLSRFSSRRRSSTPQLKAPWLPPPWSARLTTFCSTTWLRSKPAAPTASSCFINVSWPVYQNGIGRLNVKGQRLSTGLAPRELDDFQGCWYHPTREGCAFPHSGQEFVGERVSALGDQMGR